MRPVSTRTLKFLRAASIADLSTTSAASPTPRCALSHTYLHRPLHFSTPSTSFRPPRRNYSGPTDHPRSRAHDESPNPPIPSLDHYSLFPRTLPAGPPPAGPFSVDLVSLRREFLRLQASAHPDVHPGGPEKRRAEALSARINEAYRTLREPLTRAQYLLERRGEDVAGDEGARVADPGLLMEVMEAREEVEEAQTEEEVGSLREVNEERVEGSIRKLEEAFARDDVPRAKEECVRLRYWVNIRESLDAWEKGEPVVLAH